MKRFRQATSLLMVLSLVALSCPGSFADDYDRKGKLGVGASLSIAPSSFVGLGTSPGIGLRYWFTDRLGFDLNGFFSSNTGVGPGSSSTLSNGGAASLIVLLKKKNGLRLEGYFGSVYGYSHQETDSSFSHTLNRQQSVTIGVGLGAEYSFQELPDLGFSAAVTGVGASFNISDVSDVDKPFPQFNVASHSSTTTIASSPFVGLGVRYYF